MIKKLLSVMAAASALLLLASPAFAMDNIHLTHGQLNAKACDKEGKAVINVEENVTNDVDSGFGGNNWAFDNYTRHIKVWKADSDNPNEWCAALKYDGEFSAVEGQVGPGGTGIIGANVDGNMHGGYRATFNGDLKSVPLWPTHGSVGTVDYGCNLSGSTCNYVSWTDQYFDNVTSFEQPWWGWIYKAGKKHGVWLNQIDVPQANSGNIL